MSLDNSYQAGFRSEPTDPRVKAPWTAAVSCHEGLDFVLRSKSLLEALRSYVGHALVTRFDGLSPKELDRLFRDAVTRVYGKRDLAARFSCLFGKTSAAGPGSLGAYIAVAAKRLYLSELRERGRAARRLQKLVERQQRLESGARPFDLDWEAVEDLQLFREKVGRLFAAARGTIARRHWNALLERVRVRWPGQFGDPFPPWPGEAPADNPVTRRSDVYRARAELKLLIPKFAFSERELAFLFALGIIRKARPRRPHGRGIP